MHVRLTAQSMMGSRRASSTSWESAGSVAGWRGEHSSWDLLTARAPRAYSPGLLNFRRRLARGQEGPVRRSRHIWHSPRQRKLGFGGVEEASVVTASTLPAVPSLDGPKTLPALNAKGGGHPLSGISVGPA
jgi:hypothetical protein